MVPTSENAKAVLILLYSEQFPQVELSASEHQFILSVSLQPCASHVFVIDRSGTGWSGRITQT